MDQEADAVVRFWLIYIGKKVCFKNILKEVENFLFFLFEINIILMFLDYFDAVMLKVMF